MVSGLTLDLEVQNSLTGVRKASTRIKEFLLDSGFELMGTQEFEIALVESLNNLVVHASGDGKGLDIHLSVECMASMIRATISDNSPGFDWIESPELPADDFSESGRGMFLLHELVDQIDYYRGKTKNILRFEKGLIVARNERDLAKYGNGNGGSLMPVAELHDTLLQMTEEFALNNEMLSAIFQLSKDITFKKELSPYFVGDTMNRLTNIIDGDWFMFFEYHPEERDFELLSQSEDVRNPKDVERSFSMLLKQILIQCHGESWENINKGKIPLEIYNTYLPTPYQMAYVKPVILHDNLFGVMILGYKMDTYGFASAHKKLIVAFSEFLAIQIQAKRLREQQIKSSVFRQELEIARNIQQALLPNQIPVNKCLEIAASCETAQSVGGDFYGVEEVGDGEFLIYIVDVMGKGIPAALVATICRTIISVNKIYYRDPGTILEKVNKFLYNDLSSVEMFITGQVLYINTRSKFGILANAGHPPMLFKDSVDPTIHEICPEGLPIGIFEDTTFDQERIELTPSFDILLYTDGITDTVKENNKEFFGISGLRDWMKIFCNSQKSPRSNIHELKNHLHEFSSFAEQPDDQTVIAISERRGYL